MVTDSFGETPPIRDIEYDEYREKLFVDFDDGARYIFVGVPPFIHRAFADAPSRQTFYCDEIRDCYPFNRLPI